MFRFFCSLFLVCTFTFPAAARGVSDRYVSRRGESGWLFHLMSRDMSPSIKTPPSKKLKYDFTYVERTDSAKLLATVVTADYAAADSVSIKWCESTYTSFPEQIYVKPKGKNAEYRLGIALPFNVWYSIYDCSAPYRLIYYFRNGTQYEYSISPGKWESERHDVLQILNLIKLNTGKL